MPQGLVSRGDLLRALLKYGGELPPQALEALGYAPKPPASPEPPAIETPSALATPPTGIPQPAPPAPPLPASFWQPLSLVQDEIQYPNDGPSGMAPAAPPARASGRPSDYRYLAPFAQLVPRLRCALSEHRPSRAYDISRIVSRIGRGEHLHRLPRRRRTGWGPDLYVIEDRCNHLAPYVRDQAMVQLHLRRLYPAGGFHQAIYSEAHPRPRVFWSDGRVTDIAPQSGDQVLVLGDLGCLARDGERAERFWASFGAELGDRGVAALALLPCATADWDREVISPSEQRDALALLDYLAARVGTPGGEPLGPRARGWLEDFYQRLSEEVKQAPASKHACWVLAGALVREGEPRPLPQEPMRVRLYQRGGQLELGRQPGGSPLAEMRSRDGLIQWRPLAAPDPEAFWHSGQSPSWADTWGWDEYGAWVELSVVGKGGERVTQRMRWIEPGRFMMGSPEDEPERYADEGPRHEVRIGEGFWLFDTACTQALWEAVMGENRSAFKGPDRPVESVSWNDVQRFFERLNKKLPGLALGLPSEAQWEYACRAGSETPFSFGVNVTTDEVNYQGEFPYDGAAKGKYRRETVPVGSLPGNPWGLYEMHGNVFEWVQDRWHESYEGAPTDGSAWETGETGAARVVRGGSWYDVARDCRSACRDRLQPDNRFNSLGFRCARVQGSEPGGGRHYR